MAEVEELRRRKLEEALEVKSLRRIISAYLNYPEASEEDIRRYERCFKMLPSAHKVTLGSSNRWIGLLQALLSHLPSKFQKLRCGPPTKPTKPAKPGEPTHGAQVAAGRCRSLHWPTPNKACRPRTPTFKHAIRACRMLPGGVEPLTFGTYRVLEGWGAWPAGLVRGGPVQRSAATRSDLGPMGGLPRLGGISCPLYQRCISQNSYFIFEMLKAFEPPLDMSQDFEISEDRCMDNVSDNRLFSGERSHCPSQSGSESGQLQFVKGDELSSGEGGDGVYKSTKVETLNEDKKFQSSNDNAGTSFMESEYCKKIENAGTNVFQRIDDHPELSSRPCCDGHVSSSWLDPTLQFHVPLVDVDKSNLVKDEPTEIVVILDLESKLHQKFCQLVRCIIRNIVRDWAAEGKRERDECYKPILKELERLFPNRSKERPPACLVPGAGLGRLALEISCLGFVSQGNEFSYYMMICSSFILNYCQIAEEWTIYPWIHSNCNSLSDNDQLRPVSIPDVHPASAGITEGFSMCGGDFVEVYSDPSQVGAWDAVVTCFFIDTAHNIVEYIEIISKILKDGGVWINLGPLLYHFADTYNQEDEMSIELSLEDVKRVASHYGFDIEKESNIETTYTTNPRSMMQNRYYAAFWTMRKKPAHAI
ncbi:hypothetical protein BUALT_Bualt04G0063500 [Buddleja alternifolia]|uniref:carnosine N-methyltransferase n=1 Tax=Buddleja alternifolia TaxID=168488 RepID=A0AAV6XN49_9LAMI|nr:hypothetical protein BUALT_Bualt04G0063500 [Buddleja alternifolia]